MRDQVDLVITWRGDAADPAGAYEVWAARGMVRFRRVRAADGEGIDFEVLEVVGENPIGDQDPARLRSVEEERAAAAASGFSAEDPARRFIRAEHQSYPFAYERIAQLFDSPNAPDLAISPSDWAQGIQPGTHGALNVRQSRAPLWLAGPRVRPGLHEIGVREVDVLPTALAALGFPRIDGADATGQTSSERGVPPDVLLRRQDGRVLHEILDEARAPAERLYIFLLDGLSHTELEDRLASDPAALPGLRRLRERAAVMANGHIVNFPSITWPSHTTLGTGAWCGHHDVVNPSYYLREKRELVSPQGQQVRTEGFVGPGVETVYEAFHRVRGRDAFTVNVYEPIGRGADHAVARGPQPRRPRTPAGAHRRAHGGLRSALGARRTDGGGARVDARRARSGPGGGALHAAGSGASGLRVPRAHPDGRGRPRLRPARCGAAGGARRERSPHRPRARPAGAARPAGRNALRRHRRSRHGAPGRVAARQSRRITCPRIGLEAVVAEPMIWLKDLAVQVECAADGRTARVLVWENDALPTGERPELEGAEVIVEAHVPGAAPRRIARGQTGPGGVYGFATPSDLAPEELALSVRAPGFNPRRLRLDGSSLAVPLREALYGRRS